jgi:MFS family permease
VGAAGGPGVAAWIAARYGLVSPLILVGCVAVAAALAIGFLLPERTPPRESRNGRLDVLGSFAFALDARVAPFLIYGLAVWLTHAVTLQTVNFYVMDTLSVSGPPATRMAGLVLMAGAVAMLLTQLFVIPRLRWPPHRLLILGAAMVGAAHLTFALSQHYWTIMTAMVAAGVGIGLARPGVSGGASLAVSPAEQGKVAGLVMASTGIGFLLAPFTGLLMYQSVGPSAPYWINLALAAFGLAFAALHPGLRARTEIEKAPPEPPESGGA